MAIRQIPKKKEIESDSPYGITARDIRDREPTVKPLVAKKFLSRQELREKRLAKKNTKRKISVVKKKVKAKPIPKKATPVPVPEKIKIKPKPERAIPKIVKVKKKRVLPKEQPKPNIISDMDITYETSEIPDDAKNIDPSKIRNLIQIPEEVLVRMKQSGEARAKAYTDFLFQTVMPSILAFDAGNKYFQTALADGMGIDIEIDSSVEEVLQNLIRMDIITFYLKRMKFPLKYKKIFLEQLVRLMAESSVLKMEKEDKKSIKDKIIKELEGVVVRGFSKDVDSKLQGQVARHKKVMEAERQERGKPEVTRLRQDSGIQSRPGAIKRRER